jgi:putative toxin-antitoxin system antitoxin component (TIGR02293 family)
MPHGTGGNVSTASVVGTGASNLTIRSRVARNLGVPEIARGEDSAVKVHEALEAGLPRRALVKAIPEGIPQPMVLPVFGISKRTFARLKADQSKRLDAVQSSRVWRFAELFEKAVDVLGGEARAAAWMLRPAVALEKRRPIDLLTTSVGAQLVEDVVERMRYGVYQ